MIMSALRSQTRQRHERVERAVGMPAAHAAYLHMLEKFFGFLQPWEDVVIPLAARVDPSLADRRKSELLEADLRHFGYDDARLADLPRCDRLPRIDDPMRALGSMYVMEGSTLGGQVIARHLEQSLGLSAGRGYTYFLSYGRDVGAMWRSFGDVVQANSSPAADPVIISAAADTFDALYDWFSRD